jgi:hypothetical protein
MVKKPNKILGSNKYAINPEQVEMLAARFWTNVEIAAFFGVDEGTIRKGFSEILAKGRGIGKGKLRDLQWRAAESGNPTMLIWMGKQYLGQSDKLDNLEDKRLIDSELVFNDIPTDSEEAQKRFGRFLDKNSVPKLKDFD